MGRLKVLLPYEWEGWGDPGYQTLRTTPVHAFRYLRCYSMKLRNLFGEFCVSHSGSVEWINS